MGTISPDPTLIAQKIGGHAKKVPESEELKLGIAQSLVAGESQKSIADRLGTSQSTISRLAGKEDMKALIEAASLNLLGDLPDAVENLKTLVSEMKEIPKEQTKRRELSYKASHDVLKAAGIMPSPIQSQVTQNIFQSNQIQLSPIVLALLEQHGSVLDPAFDEPAKLRDGKQTA
jgi:transcriptional regulator with XRE-family HTH domain